MRSWFLQGSLNEPPCKRHEKKPPSPNLLGVSFQRLMASPGATPVEGLTDWRCGNYCCPPVASRRTTDSAKVTCQLPMTPLLWSWGGKSEVTPPFWASARLKSLGKRVSPRMRMGAPVQGFQPWCCQFLGVDNSVWVAALCTVGSWLSNVPSTRCQRHTSLLPKHENQTL